MRISDCAIRLTVVVGASKVAGKIVIAKLVSILLVVLIVLPFTAPFSTIEPGDDGQDLGTGQTAAIAAVVTQVPDDAAVWSDPTDPVGRPGLCAFAVAAPQDIVRSSSLVFSPAPITTRAALSALTTVLRV